MLRPALRASRLHRPPPLHVFSPVSIPRFNSTKPRTPPPSSSTDPSVFVEENFSKHTIFVLDVAKRFFKFSFLGLFGLGASISIAYGGLHMWVEHVLLAPEADEEVKKWEWHLGPEAWTGDPALGGTDPAISIRGRFVVRSAWMAANWGVGHSTAASLIEATEAKGLPGPGELKLVDAQLQRTEDFLRSAISLADAGSSAANPHPYTLPSLLTMHGAVLERLGSGFLQQSKAAYERAWAGFSGSGLNGAYIAEKLGDVSSRLGQKDEALQWWTRACDLAQGKTARLTDDPLPQIPEKAPSSPLAQRIISNVLVSLSAYYAQARQLRQAEAVEEASLKLLRSIYSPKSLADASAPQALHSLYLLQRASLLSMHLAEVLHGLRRPSISSIQYLASAAESSERVAHALTGIPLRQVDGVEVKSSGQNELLPVYVSSRSMNRTANNLLRDSRRTAAEAWNLMGVLHEAREGPKSKTALECYKRAVCWAGTFTDDPDVKKAAEDTLEVDWNIFWANYMRTKRAVLEQQQRKN